MAHLINKIASFLVAHFFKISSQVYNLHRLICDVINLLSNKELENVKESQFYIGDSFYKKESSPRSWRHAESVFSEQDLPMLPLGRLYINFLKAGSNYSHHLHIMLYVHR